MRILITGNMGYVGPVLVQHLRQVLPHSTLLGYDTAFFASCTTHPGVSPDRALDVQLFGDLRDFDRRHLQGVDAVVHLAAISNDPMGQAFEDVTQAINATATIGLAKAAREAGVRRFVFASSCSVYGASEGPARTARTEDAPLAPLTAYARSKVAAEAGLGPLANDDFWVTCLRFATACGSSPRLRLDLVLNDFVAAALVTGQIEILSDGTPWRPLIDVSDMARALEWAATRETGIRETGEPLTVVNVGSERWNYQIKDLARAVQATLGEVHIGIDPRGEPDRRSYRVDFSRFARLAPRHQPRVEIDQTVRDVARSLAEARFADANFRSSHLIRLRVLEALRATGRLDDELRWL